MGEAFIGLACPNCQGRVAIPEGQRIVICPYCDQRSLVRGERGVLRYQAPRAVDHDQAVQALRGFLRGFNRAPDLLRRARLSELFVAYLPFWSVWAEAAAWVFGEKQVGSGDNRRYEPREVRVLRPLNWNAAACDVAGFGVESVPMQGRPLDAFQPEALHADGMVFEPLGSAEESARQALESFEDQVRAASRLDRVASVFARLLGRRHGLVYLPLWIARYAYRGRIYQVVIDGQRREVLYGRAPGNTWFRAAILVGGMALGAFLLVDGTALMLGLLADTDDELLAAVAFPALLGAGIMAVAYHAFRFGEQIEHFARGTRRTPARGPAITDFLDRFGLRRAR